MSSEPRHAELPEELRPVMRKAVRLEWLTIAYMASAVVAVGLTLGQSQAMKAAWIEDLLSFLPPAAFLIAARIRARGATGKFPWGFHRAVSIAYLVAAFALLVMGAYVFLDSAMKLVKVEHPAIGVISLLGQEIWLGWVMLVALLWTGAPPVLLGIRKRRLADQLHDKVLYADAEMNRADWLTAGAAMLGVVGIGFGLWWADAVAASIISLDITHDGYKNLKVAVADLMDKEPTVADHSRPDPLPLWVKNELMLMDWVKDAEVRLREGGHVFIGEAFVVPIDNEDLMGRIDRANRHLLDLDWRLHELVITPVPAIHRPEPATDER